jgi:alkaline phosphatase
MRKLSVLLLLIIALLMASSATAADKPKNVILFIGDGMGPAHVTAARYARGDAFRIGTMPVVGLSTTQCADRTVTDSAAGASALATGTKANYEALSIAPSGVPMLTVLERAEKGGKATGIVTTTDFYDATPAAFTAHAGHRRRYGEIIPQILRSGAEVIAGGGLTSFGKGEVPAFDAALAGTGYTVVTKRADLDSATGEKVLVLFESQERDRDNPDFPLPVLTRFAIDRLKGDPDGFFLLVEHEGTDSGSHQNNSADVTAALKSLDEAVGIALDFAASRQDTLVVVTADHETGGMRVSETAGRRWRMEWSSAEHTATAVPVFAFGPGSAVFAGFQDNTDVGKKLMACEP